MPDPDWKLMSEEWLTNEDAVYRSERIERLIWLAERCPDCNFFLFGGGITSKALFEEVRYCFVYGQFLATIALGVAFLERLLASHLYGAGRDDLERDSLQNLIKEAEKSGLLSSEECLAIDDLRNRRNPILHFRRPLAKDSLEMKSMQAESHPYDVLQDDARLVLQIVLRHLESA